MLIRSSRPAARRPHCAPPARFARRRCRDRGRGRERLLRGASARPSRRAGPRRWVSACSTTWRSGRCTRGKAHNLNRIAVIDFDVHHGNGTQAMFGPDPDLLYASTHQSPLYPGTGAGIVTAAAQMSSTCRSARRRLGEEFKTRLRAQILLPAIDAFKPEIDPDLGRLRRPSAPIRWPTPLHRGRFRLGHARFIADSKRHAKGRVVSDPGRRLRSQRPGGERGRPCDRP